MATKVVAHESLQQLRVFSHALKSAIATTQDASQLALYERTIHDGNYLQHFMREI
jgi:hypothetical protein